MASTKTKVESPFDRGEAKRVPDLACLGVVASVDEAKSWNSNQSFVYQVNITPLGAVPYKCSAKVEVAALFFNPAFKRDDLFKDLAFEDVGEWPNHTLGAKSYDRLYSENFATREGESGIPHLLGLTGIDYDKYLALGKALQALWPNVSTAAVQEVLTAHLVDSPVGFWLVQGSKKSGEVDEITGKAKYKRTPFFNVSTPRFLNAAYFSTTDESRKKILAKIAGGKLSEADGLPFRQATFDETTSF